MQVEVDKSRNFPVLQVKQEFVVLVVQVSHKVLHYLHVLSVISAY